MVRVDDVVVLAMEMVEVNKNEMNRALGHLCAHIG